MGDELLKSIRQMAKEGKLPDEITPELTFAAIMDTNNKVYETAETVEKIKSNDLPHIEAKVDALASIQEENPSLVWLFRYKTTRTIRIALLLLAVLALLFTHAPLRNLVLAFLGISGL
jgi:hypothetical protein